MKQIDLSVLEKEKERINKQVSFVGQQIDNLEKTLQESAFLPYEYLAVNCGTIKWVDLREGEKSSRRLCFFHQDKYKPLIECPADVRWMVYHHLQDFVDNIIKNQKSRTRNENNQTDTEKS